ncbi:MAG TPA: Crp/Fnr family transcriptional regulator [Bacteroidales bacterium]|jgi:CRP-like cAMP-binding protein|nr:Crp/Fnr family transcriptional regulator [Bacteroidales bacterium]
MQYRDPYIEICIEGASSIFKVLSPSEKEMLDQHHLVMNFRKGESILNEGSRPKGIICFASGSAKLFSIGAGNREQIIKILRPAEFVSFRTLFSDSPYPYSVVALEETSTVVFEKHNMSRILRHNAELAIKFIKTISEDLIFSNKRLISLTQKHVRGRLAESLLILRDTYGFDTDGRTLNALLSREDLAHLSNMTTSNAIRTLSGFADENLVEIHGRKIVILDLKQLEEISESGQ